MDGVLIINKPKGYTSHDIVNIVKKQLNITKVGHAGTLDPNATGVLPVLIGNATKISKYLIEHDKVYIAELKLGEKSSTGDLEGEIIEKKSVPKLNEDQIKDTLKLFLGKQQQIPPMYSSIKINGKKAYEYARKGLKVEMEPREIEIMNISLMKFQDNIITFKVKCSKGTYIRVLCEDIAKSLGTVGLMKELCRIKVNEFDIKNSVTLDDIKNGNVQIINIEEIFKAQPYIKLNDRETKLFLNGVKLSVNKSDDLYRIYNSTLLGLGLVENNLLKRDVIVI